MDSSITQPFLVQAIYSFKGKNNDELCFKKGDIITVTQMEEGGWWEGTLGEKTGWFPSNYIKDYKVADVTSTLGKLSSEFINQQRANRTIIINDLIDSEKAHILELNTQIQRFLLPIQHSGKLSNEEYNQLVGNIKQVVELHESLCENLEKISKLPLNEQRIGRIFLTLAPKVKEVLHKYCSSHPRAVLIIEKYKEELGQLMEKKGAMSPGILVLTTALSKPFRRLNKYSSMLQELERYTEEGHPDRGDIQRSISVYKDCARECSEIRCKKEMELEILHCGIQGLEGDDAGARGEIIRMGSVAIGPDFRDRYFILLRQVLLIYSVSPRMTCFIYEGSLPLTGISVTKVCDSDSYKNAFQISGPLIDSIVAICQTKQDQQEWVAVLSEQIKSLKTQSMLVSVQHSHVPSSLISLPVLQSSNRTSPSPPIPPPHATIPVSNNLTNRANKSWSIMNLRPSPPVRSYLSLDDRHSRSTLNKIKYDTCMAGEKSFSEDAQILQVIESYCTSSKARYTVNSVNQVTNLTKSEKTEVAPCTENSSLLNVMNELKEEMKTLQNKVQFLTSHLEEDHETMVQFQNFVKNNFVLSKDRNLQI